MRNSKLIYILPFLLLIFSCSKETSIENGGNPGGGAIGNNCRVNTIIAADSSTGKGLYSLFTNFNTAGLGTRIEAFDSISATLDAYADLMYKGDTIRVNANDYIVMDANKRISKFYLLIDPTDPASEQFIYGYTYDAGGYLIGKSISIKSIPLPLAIFTYSWAGGNLVKIDGVTVVPGLTKKVLTANMEYDASKTAKNFIQVMPDAFETFFYVLAIDIGKKSKNVIQHISMTTYDNQGLPADTFNTTIKNLKFSTDGYLTEWFAEGDSFDALGIFSGRTIFKYKCN